MRNSRDLFWIFQLTRTVFYNNIIQIGKVFILDGKEKKYDNKG